MMKMLTATTSEIDSPDEAAAEIVAQLDLGALLAHSVGIVACHPDFLHSGAFKAVCAALPFPVLGATTIASGTNSEHSLEVLSLCVFSSNDVSFVPQLTEPLAATPQASLRSAYAAARSQMPGKPALVLAYAPFLAHFGGSDMLRTLNDAAEGAPVFGTIGCDQNSDFHDTHTLFNGEYYRDRMALLLMEGAVEPRFFVITVSEGNIQKQKGVITGSDGNLLKSVNDISCVEYMASIGLNPNDGLEGVSSIPFMVDYNDGSPPSGRSLYTFTPEGHAVCGGEMPLNATFAVGLLDSREITRAGETLFAAIVKKQAAQGVLVISCIGRSLALGLEPLAEIETVRRVVGEHMPLHMSYSGGEICPVYTEKSETINRFHNFTLIVCLF